MEFERRDAPARKVKADEVLQEGAGRYLLGPPVVTHLVNVNASADA